MDDAAAMEQSLIGDTETVSSRRQSRWTRLLFLMKVIELVLASLVTGLLSGNANVVDSAFKAELVHGTTIGFIMINGIIIFSELTQPMGKAPLVLCATAGCPLFILSGVFLVRASVSAAAVSAGVVCLLQGVLFFTDSLVSCCYRSSSSVG